MLLGWLVAPARGSCGDFTRIVVGDVDTATDVFAIDLDGDGAVDVVSTSDYDRTDTDIGTVYWHANDGSGSPGFGVPIVVASGSGSDPQNIFALDVDGDGDVNDDTVASSAAITVRIAYNATFGPAIVDTANATCPCGFLGAVNHTCPDGRVVAAACDGSPSVVTLGCGGTEAACVALRYFDSGPGVWFSVQRGTGIFYDAGLTLSAPYKNAMAVALLEEAARRNVAAPCRAARLRCDGGNATRWLEAVRRTGRAACEPWLKCRDRFVLPDHYDGFLVELGRKLGYDSLHFTASPLAPLGTAYVSEVVDLRAPPGARHRTPDELAELWRALLPRRLSLRDPNDVDDEAAAATCALPPLPTLRLACAGHVSESATAEPNRQNACRRR